MRTEHIIPEAIGGRIKILGASCHSCEKMTHAIEGRVISHLYGDARAQFGIRRGKRRKWPDKFKIKTVRASGPEQVEVSIDEHPGGVAIFNLLPPGMFWDMPDDEEFMGVTIGMLTLNEAMWDRIGKIGGRVTVGKGGLHTNEFAKFLAKIAHSYAVAELGLNAFQPVLVDAILDRPPMHLPRYVGGPQFDLAEKERPDLHELETVWVPFRGVEWITVLVHLFGYYINFPRYQVVVGKAAN